MKLHEYQSKQLFRDYDIPIPRGYLVETVEEATEAANLLNAGRWVVKAQVHTRGRGPAGGVMIVNSIAELERNADDLLNRRLVTKQTGPAGQPIRRLLIEEVVDLKKELYLGLLVDRGLDRIVVVASQHGGVDIEQLALSEPDSVHTITADLVMGLQHSHARRLALTLGLNREQEDVVASMIYKLYRLFRDKDLSLLEINPIAVTHQGELIALDAKLIVDDNALHRQSFLSSFRDTEQEDERENFAENHGLRFVSLKGNIGCIVNGAGLAMATMDLIKLQGGEPANFLDLGGKLKEESVIEAVKLITTEAKIDAILVNIFGGIVQCDLVARGLLRSIDELTISTPIVVRFQGTNADEGYEILEQSTFDFCLLKEIEDATQKVVELAR